MLSWGRSTSTWKHFSPLHAWKPSIFLVVVRCTNTQCNKQEREQKANDHTHTACRKEFQHTSHKTCRKKSLRSVLLSKWRTRKYKKYVHNNHVTMEDQQWNFCRLRRLAIVVEKERWTLPPRPSSALVGLELWNSSFMDRRIPRKGNFNTIFRRNEEFSHLKIWILESYRVWLSFSFALRCQQPVVIRAVEALPLLLHLLPNGLLLIDFLFYHSRHDPVTLTFSLSRILCLW